MKNICYIVRNNNESKKVQEKYLKEGFKWWDIGKGIKSLPIGKYGTLIDINKLDNTIGNFMLNTFQDLKYAKTKFLIVNLNNKNKLEI